jgi:hypothetical protein
MHYVLDKDNKPVEADIDEWGKFFENIENRRVASTMVGAHHVSTVFLGIDHNWSDDGSPILWETMIFSSDVDIDNQCWRYSSYEDALKGHAAAIDWLKSRQKTGFIKKLLNRMRGLNEKRV